MRWLDPISRPSGKASPAPIRKPTTTRYRLPMASMISSPENSQASQLPSAGSYGLVGDKYSNHLCTTAHGDGKTSGLIQPSEDAPCQMAITTTGTSNPCKAPPIFCFAMFVVLADSLLKVHAFLGLLQQISLYPILGDRRLGHLAGTVLGHGVGRDLDVLRCDVIGVWRIADGVVKIFLGDLILEDDFAYILLSGFLVVHEGLGGFQEAAHELLGQRALLFIELLGHHHGAHRLADRGVVRLHDFHAETLVDGLRGLRFALHHGVDVLAQQRLVQIGESQIDDT